MELKRVEVNLQYTRETSNSNSFSNLTGVLSVEPIPLSTPIFFSDALTRPRFVCSSALTGRSGNFRRVCSLTATLPALPIFNREGRQL